MKYSSNIDIFYTIFIVIIGIVGILISDLFFLLGFWYISLIVFIMFSFLYYLFFTTSYELKEDFLQINIGVFKKIIKYKDIKEIKSTKNSVSSFATSRKRIGIRLGDKTGLFNYCYISPKCEDDFVIKLKEKLNVNNK